MTTQPSGATPGLTPELEEAIRRGYAQRDRANMGPTIAYFESLLAEHPDHPVLVYEVAGAYDTAGQEEKALKLYERAMDLGLAGDALRRCLCQYGSTLRWLGQYDKSLAALDRAQREWPESDAVRVFRALTLNDADRSDEAVAELMTVITAHAEVTDLGRWAEGLRGLAQWLADGRPDSLLSPGQRPGGWTKASSLEANRPGTSPVAGVGYKVQASQDQVRLDVKVCVVRQRGRLAGRALNDLRPEPSGSLRRARRSAGWRQTSGGTLWERRPKPLSIARVTCAGRKWTGKNWSRFTAAATG